MILLIHQIPVAACFTYSLNLSLLLCKKLTIHKLFSYFFRWFDLTQFQYFLFIVLLICVDFFVVKILTGRFIGKFLAFF